MANIFGNKDNQPEGKDENSTATTTAQTGGDSADAQVSDKEANALDGAGGPNRTPAFAKQDYRDENVQLTDTDDLQSAKTGAAAQSGLAEYDAVANEALALAGDAEEGDDRVTYTSQPIANFRMGEFQFDKGVLKLKPADAERFDKMLDGADERTQAQIRKIDRSAGEAVARRYLDLQSKTTQGIDNTGNTVSAPTPKPAS